jgi:Protein of unknown function (DUF3043)
VFRRRQPAEQAAEAAELSPAKQDGKGRPTPKRKDAQRGRRPIGAPPRDRKEWSRQRRASAREQRVRTRLALEGDPRYQSDLPPRDRGPIRKFARDYVDSRRSVGEYFLITAVVILVAGFIPNPVIQLGSLLVWLGLMVLIVVDSLLIVRGVKREVRRRFPDENLRGVGAYAVIRSLQIRGWRMPKPQVSRGAQI